MTNLRNAEDYNVGIDLGTGSVGWSVSDHDGVLYTFKGDPTWGSRLFPSADSAAEARIHRGQRRRYDRRRQRLDLLQELFCFEMEKVDPYFFVRMNQSRLLMEDREGKCSDYHWPFFNDSDFTERDYYAKFPTIYHLRAWLTETEEQADIRLIYLAFHNIVKARGNFLHQDNPSLSAKDANMNESVERLCMALERWFAESESALTDVLNAAEIAELLGDKTIKRADAKKKLTEMLHYPKDQAKAAGALASLLLGLKGDPALVFGVEPGDGSIVLSEDDKVEAFRDMCPDEGMELFDAMLAVYSSRVLMGILKAAQGRTISYCKIAEYEKYAEDLSILKDLVKTYKPRSYDAFFRGEVNPETHGYIPSKAEGYTLFNLRRDTKSQEDFYKAIPKLFKATAAESDERYLKMMQDISEGSFLHRLKTSSNGAIPYQLHLEEMHAIIDKQSAYYPFLADAYDSENEQKSINKIESLVTFRIPYYVGPLTQKNAATDSSGANRFAWSERIEGQESEKIYPWNWADIIDKDKSAENFMNRMIGSCTYLHGEQVLPRCSLLYEEFCVLNELAGARWSADGDKSYRFDYADRVGIVEDLFKKRKTVSYKAISDWLGKHGHFGHITVEGAQGAMGFESKLSSYNDFCKLLHVSELSDADVRMAEEIILWNTLFEDRDILKRKLRQRYGERLTDEQIKKICKTRYTGWGRLSKKLLAGIQLPTDCGLRSVIDILREGDVNNGRRIGQAMTFMEILHDDHLGLQHRIDEINAKKQQNQFALEDLPGSPALRRSVNQSLRIIEEITSIAGCSPANIYIEVTRDAEDPKKKGRRTQKRIDAVREALEVFKKEDPELWSELQRVSPADFSDRVELYFRQRGKCLYSGKRLDFANLHLYQIDHIIPQSWIKDDSVDNKALVLSSENQKKTDMLLIDPAIRQRMGGYWRELHDAGLMSDKKFNNLKRDRITESQMKGFVARQLVETSQMVKALKGVLKQRYPDANIVPVKAALTSQLRDAFGLVKCREANDYHHAHDAYLASEMGRFIQFRHGEYLDNPIRMAHVMKEFVRKEGEAYRHRKRPLGSAGFFVESFKQSGFDAETGEVFKDAWDAEAEIARLKRCLGYRTCYISRMPEETSGAFWDATVYSPHDTKKALTLPLKKGLEVSKYGSYSGNKPAYFFIFKVENVKGKVKVKYYFDGVPVSLRKAIESKDITLPQLASSIVSEPEECITIIKPRIMKYQRIADGADEFYLPALDCVYSSKQLFLSSDMTRVVNDIAQGNDASEESLTTLYDVLTEKASVLCSRFAVVQEKLESGRQAFVGLAAGDKKALLLGLVRFYKGANSRVDLSLIGGPKNSGGIRNGFVTDKIESLVFIDQSVTGMFERRYKLEL